MGKNSALVPRVGGGPTGQCGPGTSHPGKGEQESLGASGDPQGLAVLGLKDKAKEWGGSPEGVGLISMLITDIKWLN